MEVRRNINDSSTKPNPQFETIGDSTSALQAEWDNFVLNINNSRKEKNRQDLSLPVNRAFAFLSYLKREQAPFNLAEPLLSKITSSPNLKPNLLPPSENEGTIGLSNIFKNSMSLTPNKPEKQPLQSDNKVNNMFGGALLPIKVETDNKAQEKIQDISVFGIEESNGNSQDVQDISQIDYGLSTNRELIDKSAALETQKLVSDKKQSKNLGTPSFDKEEEESAPLSKRLGGKNLSMRDSTVKVTTFKDQEIDITSIDLFMGRIYVGVFLNKNTHYLAVIELDLETAYPLIETLQMYKIDNYKEEGLEPVFYYGGSYLWDRVSQNFYKLDAEASRLQKVEVEVPKDRDQDLKDNESPLKSIYQGGDLQSRQDNASDARPLSFTVSKFLLGAIGEDGDSGDLLKSQILASEQFSMEGVSNRQTTQMVALLHPYNTSTLKSTLSLYSLDNEGIDLLLEVPLSLKSPPICLEVAKDGALVIVGGQTEMSVFHLRKNREKNSSPILRALPAKPTSFFNNKAILSVQFNNSRNRACIKWTGADSNISLGILWSLFAVSSGGAFRPLGQTHKEIDEFGMNYSKKSDSIAVLHHKEGSSPLLSLFQVNSSNKDIIVFSRNIHKNLYAVNLQRGLVITVEPKDPRSKNHTHLKIFQRNQDCGTLVKGKIPSFQSANGDQELQDLHEPAEVHVSQSGYTFLRLSESKKVTIVDVLDWETQKTTVSQFQLHNPMTLVSFSQEGSHIALLETDPILRTETMHLFERSSGGEFKKSNLKMETGMQFLRFGLKDHSLVVFYNRFRRAIYFYVRDYSKKLGFLPVLVCSLKNYIGPRGDFTVGVLGKDGLFSVTHDSYCKLLELRDSRQLAVNIFEEGGLRKVLEAKIISGDHQEDIQFAERITFKKVRCKMEGVAGSDSLEYLVVPYKTATSAQGISIWEKDFNEDSYSEVQKFRGFSVQPDQIFFREASLNKDGRPLPPAFLCYEMRSQDVTIFEKDTNTDSFHLQVRVSVDLPTVSSLRPDLYFSKVLVCGRDSTGAQLLQFTPQASFFGDCAFLKRRVVEIFGVNKGLKRAEIRVDETLLDSLCDSVDRADIIALGSIRLLSLLVEIRNYKLLDKALKQLGYNSHLYPEELDPLHLALKSKDRTVLDILGAHLRKRGGSFSLDQKLILEGLQSTSQIFRGFITQNFLQVSRPTYPLKYQLAVKTEPVCLHHSSATYSLDSEFKEWVEGQSEEGASQDYHEVKYLTASVKEDYRICSPFMRDFIKVIEDGNREIATSDLKAIIWALWDQNLLFLQFMAVSFWVFACTLVFKLAACRNEEECRRFFSVLGCSDDSDCFGIMRGDRLPRYLSYGSLVVLGVSLVPLIFFEVLVLTEKRLSYFGSLDNFFDLLIYVGIFPLMYFTVRDPSFDQEPLINFLVTSYIFFVGIRAIFYLRVQDELRHFIRMMIQVFKDIQAFCTVMFTLIFVMAVIMVLQKRVDGEEITYLDLMVRFNEIYLLGFGEFQETSITEMKWYQSIVFLLQTVFFTLIMFNFLIAIVSATHDEISEESEFFSIREQASLLADLSYFRIALSRVLRTRPDKKYLHLVIGTDEVRYTYGIEASGGSGQDSSKEALALIKIMDSKQSQIASLVIQSSKQTKILRRQMDSLQGKMGQILAQGVGVPGQSGGMMIGLHEPIEEVEEDFLGEDEEEQQERERERERGEVDHLQENSQSGYEAGQGQTIEVIKEVPVIIEKEINIPIKIFVEGPVRSPVQSFRQSMRSMRSINPTEIQYILTYQHEERLPWYRQILANLIDQQQIEVR